MASGILLCISLAAGKDSMETQSNKTENGKQQTKELKLLEQTTKALGHQILRTVIKTFQFESAVQSVT